RRIAESLDCGVAEHPALLDIGARQSSGNETIRLGDPPADRRAEGALLPIKDLVGNAAAHGALERHLQSEAGDLLSGGHAHREIDEFGIEKWMMRHYTEMPTKRFQLAHAVIRRLHL